MAQSQPKCGHSDLCLLLGLCYNNLLDSFPEIRYFV